MATATTTKAETTLNKTLAQPQSSEANQAPRPHPEDLHPIATADPSLNVSASPSSPAAEGKKNISDTDGDVGGGGPVTDTQKKIRRAERFGMPVQLSEQEKRNSRAERFGTGTDLHGSETSKKSEELKRKARAERFGIAQSTSPDEDAKKKARLARFAPASIPDAVEEDKRKARAIRFSQSASLTKENGKGNIDMKAAVVGEAGGGPSISSTD